MESDLRLRLVFEDGKMLSKSQRKEGLKQSWVLLKPHHHESISEVADHLLRVFDLDDSCPDGLVLSMDGFVLPPFESTSILKEKDIIRVKRKKGSSSTELIGVGDGRKSFHVEEVAEQQNVVAGMKLLANEEFAKESGGYESESESEGEEDELENLEDKLHLDNTPEKKVVSKKRKASKKLKRSNDRKKRKKCATVEECSGTREDIQNEVQPKQNESSHQHILLLENTPVKNDKPLNTNGELDYSSASESDDRTNNINVATPIEKRSFEPQENGKKSVGSSHTHDGAKKGPGRSTRRKKAKRKWLREQAKMKENELHQTQLHKTDNGQTSAKDNCKFAEEPQEPDKGDCEEGDVVPVVVGPGHIRFESSEKVDADQPIRQPEISLENFQWNGITSKRKGQKWGKEKTVFYERNDQKKRKQESSEMIIEKVTTVNGAVDFDKLKPCTSVPQEGDTVAYRLIELSPSWTPELCSFRVGKVAKYDPKLERITLVQVPEYPIVFEQQGEDASAAKPETSIYGEDGSLEIDYLSLVDVRIIKHGNLSAAKSVPAGVSQVALGDQGRASSSRQKSKKEPKGKEPAAAPPQANGKANVWDEICEALNAKKAQLSQVDNWTKKGGSSSGSWSYKALRGSAVGPTMARLRAQNEI